MPKLGQDEKQTYASLQAGTNPPFHGVCVCACVCVCVCVLCVCECVLWVEEEGGWFRPKD